MGPDSRFGRGVAYSTNDPLHLLNVPAGRMSALVSEPDDFVRFVASVTGRCEPQAFEPRRLWGDYITRKVTEAERGARSRVHRVQSTAVALDRHHGRWRLLTSDGRNVDAAAVVLATGLRTPRIPALEPLHDGGLCSSPGFEPMGQADPRAPVLLVGTGLSMLDAVLSLARDERLRFVAVSRHGLLPRVHDTSVTPAKLPFPGEHADARGLVRWTREAIDGASDWRSIVDGLRPHTQRVWATLPDVEKRRLLRHVRRLWEVHRHRCAPEIHERIQKLVDEGRLEIRAAQPVASRCVGALAQVTLKQRNGKVRTETFSRVLSCVGPSLDLRSTDDPLFLSAFTRGHAVPHPLGLGLRATVRGEVVGRHGAPSPGLYAIGPMLAGELWESTAIPELRAQAFLLARSLASGRHGIESPIRSAPA